jgi:hypothetical protein
MAKQYSFAELAQLSGAGRARLNHWGKKGLIVGDVQARAGRGRHQVYSLYNALEAAIAAQLGDLNATVAIMSSIQGHLRQLEQLARMTGKMRATALRARRELTLQAIKRTPGLRPLAVSRDAQFTADLKAWSAFRDPQKRQGLDYFGVTYSYLSIDPAAEAKAHSGDANDAEFRRKFGLAQLIAVPKGQSISVGWFGRAAVIVNIGALLESLETATGDSLAAE